MNPSLRIYDNGGKTIDRYTAVYMNQREGKRLYSALGMSKHPFHPQGFGQHCTAMPGRHLGKRIGLHDLPPDCRQAVLSDIAAQ